MQWEAREGAISLFVENLPERLHWKILWFAFARRGEVVNVYIARRRSRGDKRFRFVMMKNLEEADRVTQRFNGTTLYGLRLVVKIARDNQGHDWKRNTRGIAMEDEVVLQKDQKLTAFHGNGDEESNKKVCTLGHDEKVMVGNSVGIQRVIFVEKVCQEITKADGSDNGPIGVSSNRSGPEIYIGGFGDEEFAARAYDLVAVKVWDESAVLNFSMHNHE
ncbi:hypothetical protein V6N12_049817 [Hibiscus sabdariffa]|uniref:RRM domain-containing protein n=1 Tax=Hibiscus sabdariffa TaxID=183260 RepID=A0ABR2GBI7_9ROSI